MQVDTTPSLSRSATAQLKKAGYFGTDLTLDIALHEYDYLIKEVAPGEYDVIVYDSNYQDTIGLPTNPVPVCYGRKTIYDTDIEEAFDHDSSGILSFTGSASKEEWMQVPIQHRISDVEHYNGSLALHPVQYPMSIGELLKSIKNPR